MADKNNRSPAKLSHRGRLGFLIKDSVLYGGAAALSKAFSLITFPLIARHFSTADYGAIDFFGVLTTFLGVLVIFGQDSAVARFFYEHEGAAERRRLISQAFVFQLVTVVILGPVLWFSAAILSALLIDIPDAKYLFKLVVLQMPFLVITNFSQNLLKWSLQRNQFLLISLGSMASAVLLITGGIVLLQIDVAGILLIGLFNYAIFGLLGLWFVRNWLIIPRDMHYLRELLPFAIPLGIVSSVGAFVPTLERWLTADLLGAEELGMYAVGIRVAMLVSLVIGAFQTAWGPFYLSIYKQENAIQTYNLVLKLFILTMVLLVYLLSTVAYPLIVLLATERYAAGIRVIFPLAIGLVIQASSWITEIGIGISKNSRLHIYPYIAYLAFSIFGIYIFTNWLGLIGVALGVLMGHVVKAIYASWLAQQAYPMDWAFRPVLIFFVGTIVYGLVTLWIMDSYGPNAGIHLFGIGFFVFAFFGVLSLFSQAERNSLWLFVKRKIGILVIH